MADKKGIGLIQSMKGKAALMGVLAIASSVVIGGVFFATKFHPVNIFLILIIN